mgnify:CR=1 FL=1
MATLKEHEILCEQRYISVEKRLANLESKIDQIQSKIDEFQSFLIKIMVKSGLVLFTTIAGAVVVIKV